jgi:hypothetical protein
MKELIKDAELYTPNWAMFRVEMMLKKLAKGVTFEEIKDWNDEKTKEELSI